MELQLLLILIIAFLLLGPEGMLNLATKLGELARQARDIIDKCAVFNDGRTRFYKNAAAFTQSYIPVLVTDK
ncbi:MAG TPA: hypothetical protein EYP32_06935, partial [Aquificaceae bacterium]|nr:hypothetical protein [Aquificaceae bacterium]